jgi:hypothetical protein
MVGVAVVNDDPADGTPVLVAFAGGGALFFGGVFGVALWQTRRKADPELDRIYAELALEPAPMPSASLALGATRTAARAYIVLGAIVTALGLVAIIQEGLDIGNPAVTLYVLVAIVVAWAAAVPLVLRRAHEAATALLSPLGLQQHGSRIEGERHGRRVSIEFSATGSETLVGSVVIRRRGHDGAAWLRDLSEAERQAAALGD